MRKFCWWEKLTPSLQWILHLQHLHFPKSYLNEQVCNILICLLSWIMFLPIIYDVWQHLSIVMYLNCLSEIYEVLFVVFMLTVWKPCFKYARFYTLTSNSLHMCTLLLCWFNVHSVHYHRSVFAESLLYNLYVILELHELCWHLGQKLNAQLL